MPTSPPARTLPHRRAQRQKTPSSYRFLPTACFNITAPGMIPAVHFTPDLVYLNSTCAPVYHDTLMQHATIKRYTPPSLQRICAKKGYCLHETGI
jgi:hypothetical protein